MVQFDLSQPIFGGYGGDGCVFYLTPTPNGYTGKMIILQGENEWYGQATRVDFIRDVFGAITLERSSPSFGVQTATMQEIGPVNFFGLSYRQLQSTDAGSPGVIIRFN